MADFSGIYMIQNYITKKVYIGQSVHVYERIYKHLWALKNNKHRNVHLQNSFNLYGIDNFRFGIVDRCAEEDLNKRETFWINFFHSTDEDKGYNLLDGGGSKYHHAEESKEKIRKALMGHKLSDESIAKMMDSQKRFWESEKGEQRRKEASRRSKEYFEQHPEAGHKHSAALKEHYKNNPVSEETRLLLSEAQKRRYLDPEERRKSSERSKQVMSNPETRRKLSEINKGKTISKETRAKIKETNKDQQIPVLCIELDVIYPSMHDAARALNMSPGHIPDCCKGKRNTAGGYHWAYVLKEESADIR